MYADAGSRASRELHALPAAAGPLANAQMVLARGGRTAAAPPPPCRDETLTHVNRSYVVTLEHFFFSSPSVRLLADTFRTYLSLCLVILHTLLSALSSL